MKKIIICAFAAVIMTLLSGCAGSAVSSINNRLAPLINSAQAADISVTPTATADLSLIGIEQAKEIALKHANLTANDVTFVESKLDYDDGRAVYDIEFYFSGTEYDYEIDAYTGDILSYDYDIDNYNAQPAQTVSGYISLEQAKTIALDKAGLTAAQVTYTETAFEYDDAIAVYNIEFISGGTEYEFEINAVTGEIIEFEKESVTRR